MNRTIGYLMVGIALAILLGSLGTNRAFSQELARDENAKGIAACRGVLSCIQLIRLNELPPGAAVACHNIIFGNEPVMSRRFKQDANRCSAFASLYLRSMRLDTPVSWLGF